MIPDSVIYLNISTWPQQLESANWGQLVTATAFTLSENFKDISKYQLHEDTQAGITKPFHLSCNFQTKSVNQSIRLSVRKKDTSSKYKYREQKKNCRRVIFCPGKFSSHFSPFSHCHPIVPMPLFHLLFYKPTIDDDIKKRTQ